MTAPRPLPWKFNRLDISTPDGRVVAEASLVTVYAERAVNAFDALLAVAKVAAEIDPSLAGGAVGFVVGQLDRAHPGWREWTP